MSDFKTPGNQAEDSEGKVIANPFYELGDIEDKLRFLGAAIPAWAEKIAKADAVDRLDVDDDTFTAIDGLRSILGDLADDLERASEVAESLAESERVE